MRKATGLDFHPAALKWISIPAFREEGDGDPLAVAALDSISIPAFREEGDERQGGGSHGKGISIPAFREEGDLFVPLVALQQIPISIPAFREEGDVSDGSNAAALWNFNPRLP